MYKVAICDDEKATCAELDRMLQNLALTVTAKRLQETFEVESFFD